MNINDIHVTSRLFDPAFMEGSLNKMKVGAAHDEGAVVNKCQLRIKSKRLSMNHFYAINSTFFVSVNGNKGNHVNIKLLKVKYSEVNEGAIFL